MGDVVFPVFPAAGQMRAALTDSAASYAADCAAYVALLEDMLARYAVLAVGDIAWGDTAQIWLRDATRLLGEIRSRSAAIRLAVPVSDLFVELRRCVDLIEGHRPHDVNQPNGLMADARTVNEDLKARLNPPRETNRAVVIPVSVVPSETHGVRVAEPLSPVVSGIAHAGLEACSAVYHAQETARAVAAMFLALFGVLPSFVRSILSHARLLQNHAATLEGSNVRVMRKDAGDFLPTGGDAA